MAISPSQLADLLKLRAVGWSQQEIADAIGVSQQVVAYQLKKLRERSMKENPDDVFSAILLGGIAVGASLGALAMLVSKFGKK
tara:strand:+ start:175 stop:423 length:249 start_codon:yes stop_codon:yes gene_type:complete